MYSATSARTASRMLAREPSGEVHEIRAYEAYRCEGAAPLDLAPAACERGGPYYRIDYVDRETADYLGAEERAPVRGDARPVELVRRIWRFRGSGEPAVEDCPVASCRAVRR
jgi:hypothetical protein